MAKLCRLPAYGVMSIPAARAARRQAAYAPCLLTGRPVAALEDVPAQGSGEGLEHRQNLGVKRTDQDVGLLSALPVMVPVHGRPYGHPAGLKIYLLPPEGPGLTWPASLVTQEDEQGPN